MSTSRCYGGIVVVILSLLTACSSGGLRPGSGCPEGQHYEDSMAAANSREKISCVTNGLCNEDEVCSQLTWHCVPKSQMNCSADKDCIDTRIPACVFSTGKGVCGEATKASAWACVANYEENVLCQFSSGGVSREVSSVCLSGTCDSGKCTKPMMSVDGGVSSPPDMVLNCSESVPCMDGEKCEPGDPSMCVNACRGENGQDVYGRERGALHNPPCGGSCGQKTCLLGQSGGTEGREDQNNCAEGLVLRRWEGMRNPADPGNPTNKNLKFCLKQ